MNQLTPAQRLIVAADPKWDAGVKPTREDTWLKVQKLCQDLRGTGVCIKVNSALRACGYKLIDLIHSYGLSVFADLKLFDIPETIATDGVLLRESKPELLTTVCVAGVSAMKALKAELPGTEILGVTVLTSLKEADTLDMFHATVEASAMKFAMVAEAAGVDGFICAPTDVGLIKSVVKREMSYNTPAIRPTWAIVPGDDQNPDRIMTPAKAIRAGADRIVVGRPIMNAPNRLDAVVRTIEEIASVAP